MSERPETGSTEYLAWFWIQHLRHLREYATPQGLGDAADLHEDLREIGYEAADESLTKLIAERDDALRQLAVSPADTTEGT